MNMSVIGFSVIFVLHICLVIIFYSCNRHNSPDKFFYNFQSVSLRRLGNFKEKLCHFENAFVELKKQTTYGTYKT